MSRVSLKISGRYLPQNPDEQIQTCRSLANNPNQMFLKQKIFSAKMTQNFLREMRTVSGSNCDCLPDCELTDLLHSVTTTNFM